MDHLRMDGREKVRRLELLGTLARVADSSSVDFEWRVLSLT